MGRLSKKDKLDIEFRNLEVIEKTAKVDELLKNLDNEKKRIELEKINMLRNLLESSSIVESTQPFEEIKFKPTFDKQEQCIIKSIIIEKIKKI